MIFLKIRTTIWPTHQWHVFFNTTLAAHFTEEAKAKPRRPPYGNIGTSMNAHGTSITLLARRNLSKLLSHGITEIVDPYPESISRKSSYMQLTSTAEPSSEYQRAVGLHCWAASRVPSMQLTYTDCLLSTQHIVDLHSWTAFRVLLDRHNRNRTSLSRTICKVSPEFSWAHGTAEPSSWHPAEIDIPYWNPAPQLTSLSPIIRPPEK